MHFLFEKRKPDKQLAVVEKVLSLFLFVEFEIISGSADWKRTENGGIRTMGCAFRIAAAGNFGDLKRNLVKQKPWVQASGFSMELSERNVSFH